MRKPQKLQYNFDTREFAVPEDKTIISRDWKKKWIIYTRVSTEEQKRKWSWI